MAKAAPAKIVKEAEKLREQLRYHEYRYHVLDDPEDFGCCVRQAPRSA